MVTHTAAWAQTQGWTGRSYPPGHGSNVWVYVSCFLVKAPGSGGLATRGGWKAGMD